jgi:hypothetical protein
MTKDAFHSDLQILLAQGNFTLPFWASGKGDKGHPLDAKMLIIGYNPSSAPISWNLYWDREAGFDMGKYQQQHSKVSRTRKNIYDLVALTIGLDATYVNTNIFWNHCSRAKFLLNKTPADLIWLLKRLPSDIIVITHGVRANTAYAVMNLMYPRFPKAISSCHLSGLGTPKGVSFNAEYSKLIKQVLDKC